MRACLATTSVTIATNGVFQRQEGMFHPRLPDLFKALVISRATAHTIEILRNERVIGLRQGEPINWRVAVVTRICPYRQPDLGPDGKIKLCNVFDISNYDIRAGHKVWDSGTDCMLHRWQGHRFRFAVKKLVDLDRLHHAADGDRSNYCTRVRWPAHRIGKLF